MLKRALVRVWNFVRTNWRRLALVVVLSALGTLAVLKVHIAGIEVGRLIGHCEVACSVLGADFVALDTNSSCQCEAEYGFLINIPMKHDYFN